MSGRAWTTWALVVAVGSIGVAQLFERVPTPVGYLLYVLFIVGVGLAANRVAARRRRAAREDSPDGIEREQLRVAGAMAFQVAVIIFLVTALLLMATDQSPAGLLVLGAVASSAVGYWVCVTIVQRRVQ